MYIYLIVFIILVFSSLIEFHNMKTPRWLYYILMVILIAMFCLRYGQGTDYQAYKYIYNSVAASLNPAAILQSSGHGEIGWLYINAVFKILHIPFMYMILFISLIASIFFARFINKFCEYKILALTISYPTLYLTYMYSAIRQGLIICVFLGLLLDLFLQKKWKSYFLIVFILTLIHSSALSFLLPILIKGEYELNHKMILFIIISWIIGLLLYLFGKSIISLLSFLPGSFSYYLMESNLSIISIIERLVMFLFTCYLFSNKVGVPDFIKKVFNVYCIGMMIYGLFIWNPLISSRFCYPFKALEILLISNLINPKGAYLFNKYVVVSFLLSLSSVMYLKNVNAYIEQGEYYSFVNKFNYPYVSLLTEDIGKYRQNSTYGI